MRRPDIEKMEKKRDVERLIKPLQHEDSNVRERAAIALGKISDARAVEPLTQALKDEDRTVRREMKEALKKIKAKKF